MMKKSKMKNSNKVTNKTNNKVTDNMKNSNSNEKIGFESDSKSFEYDENSDHSFELRDCK